MSSSFTAITSLCQNGGVQNATTNQKLDMKWKNIVTTIKQCCNFKCFKIRSFESKKHDL